MVLAALNIIANGTTTVGGVGSHTKLLGVRINKAGAAANLLTVKDTRTGNTLGTIDTTALTVSPDWYGLRGADGFTFVLATGTAADITVIYE